MAQALWRFADHHQQWQRHLTWVMLFVQDEVRAGHEVCQQVAQLEIGVWEAALQAD